MDQQETFSKAAAFAAGVVDRVQGTQLDRPSLCDDWDVRAAIEHLQGGQQIFLGAAGAAVPTDNPGLRELQASVAAAYTPEVLAGMVTAPNGDELPGSLFFNIAIMENAIHALDIGLGAGLDIEVPDDIAPQVLEIVSMIAPGGRPHSFDDEVAVAQGATLTQRILGVAGRRV